MYPSHTDTEDISTDANYKHNACILLFHFLAGVTCSDGLSSRFPVLFVCFLEPLNSISFTLFILFIAIFAEIPLWQPVTGKPREEGKDCYLSTSCPSNCLSALCNLLLFLFPGTGKSTAVVLRQSSSPLLCMLRKL